MTSSNQAAEHVLLGIDLRRYPRRGGNLQAHLTIVEAWAPVANAERPLVVAVRNVSLNGVCFLFSAQLFPGDVVALNFGKLQRRYHVARCRRLADDAYEIGAQLVAQSEGERAT